MSERHKFDYWLVVGVIVGYILGFSYFALGVYIHSKNNAKKRDPEIYLKYYPVGITR